MVSGDFFRKCTSHIGRNLTRILTETFGLLRHGRVRNQAYWDKIFARQQEQQCPAIYFQKAALAFRKDNNLPAAEDICNRGLAIHPADLFLLIEHAEIAKAAKDTPARATRFQRVVDLAGKATPISVHRNLAESHLQLGDFKHAESSLQDAIAHNPNDFSLQEKMSQVLAVAGPPAKAIAALKGLISRYPHSPQIPAYLSLSTVLAAEGLVFQAIEALTQGLEKYPESTDLKHKLAELTYLINTPDYIPQSLTPPLSQPASSHHEDSPPDTNETLCFSVGADSYKRFIPALLGFKNYIEPPSVPRILPEVDVFAVWETPNNSNKLVEELAAVQNKPLLSVDVGLLNTLGVDSNFDQISSIVVNPKNVCFDPLSSSYLEASLNLEGYTLTDEEITRSKSAINLILRLRLSRYYQAKRIETHSQVPTDSQRRVLLVDQLTNDSCLSYVQNDSKCFSKMLEAVAALSDSEVLIKLCPDTNPTNSRSQLRQHLPHPLPPNFKIIREEVNPYDLFDGIDQVYVCTSVIGFEAVMAGKEVHCFAAAFYSGWGFTIDHVTVPGRRIRRTPAEIFYHHYITHSRYYISGKGKVELETFLENYTKISLDKNQELTTKTLPSGITKPPLRILILVHCGRFGASGRYIQNLAWSLSRIGCRILIVAEGKGSKLVQGVRWSSLTFEGARLAGSLRNEIIEFQPDIVYESGVRSRPQRAALEILLLTNARFAMQSEDDDIQAYQTHHSDAAAAAMAAVDKQYLNSEDLTSFFQNNNWQHSISVALNPEFDRWIEPVLRMLCYRLASLHTAIWHPFAHRLAQEYGMPTMVVPPVASNDDFERLPLTAIEKTAILTRYGISDSHTVLFLGGTLYAFSNEYLLFLTALNLTYEQTAKPIALVISSGAGRPKLPIDTMARTTLNPGITFVNLGSISDIGYTEMLKACDIVCSPGIPDTFNKFRLPSRLVKAMAMGKPILTCRCGFGESLENGHNAFLTEGNDPADWISPISACLDATHRATVGANARIFASQNFRSDQVATSLKVEFENLMMRPQHRLENRVFLNDSNSITHSPSNLSHQAMKPHTV